MTRPRIPAWLWAAVAATALLSLYAIYRRHQVETLNRATTMVAEFETVESLSSAQGEPLPSALTNLKAQGLGGVVLGEQTIGELISQGRLSISTISARNTPTLSSLKFNDMRVLPRVVRGLRVRFHDLAGRLMPRGNTLALPPVSQLLVRSTSIGLDPDEASLAQAQGLAIVARFGNPPGVSSATVRETLQWAREMGTVYFLPQGDQVLGRRDATEDTIDELKRLGIFYASPEFAKIGGDEEVVAKSPENVIRLHSAQIAELDKLSKEDAIDRYVKAARERQMHLLLVRPISLGAPQPLTAFADFIKQINVEIQREGGMIGTPHPFENTSLPRVFFVLLGIAIAPVVWFCGAVFFKNGTVLMIGAGLIGLLALACWMKQGQQLMALAGSIAFPFIAFVAFDSLRPKNILTGYALISGVSLVGGLCVAGMLNGLIYFVKAAEFPGIRVAVFLPIFLVGLYYWMRLTDWREALRNPITWGTAALAFGIAISLALMLARTGNDSAVGASGGEMAFRNLLDRVLYVRPRTKEFLIGHPLLILAIGLLPVAAARGPEDVDGAASRYRARAGWAVLLMMLGAIGQTSVVNTLCHLHIPVILSFARIAEGLIIGCMIGLALWAAMRAALPAKEF